MNEGDRVVCIDDGPGADGVKSDLVKGAIYTIKKIYPNLPHLKYGNLWVDTGVDLWELQYPEGEGCWWIGRFRPLDGKSEEQVKELEEAL